MDHFDMSIVMYGKSKEKQSLCALFPRTANIWYNHSISAVKGAVFIMNRRTIHLAGGCYWGVEKYMSNIPGVLETEVGFANGRTHHPTYRQVCDDDTGHAETVRVVYDADLVSLNKLLRLFFRIIDPVSLNRQGGDAGVQYRTGVYYTEPADEAVIRTELANLAVNYADPLAVECLPLEHFYPAEEYHQKYLDKNPAGYCHVPWAAINAVKTVVLDEV